MYTKGISFPWSWSPQRFQAAGGGRAGGGRQGADSPLVRRREASSEQRGHGVNMAHNTSCLFEGKRAGGVGGRLFMLSADTTRVLRTLCPHVRHSD